VAGQGVRCGVGEDPVGQWEQVGLVRAERCAGVAAGGQRADLDFWVAEEQTEQLTARVPARSAYRDPDRHVDDYARSCKVTQPRSG
jgi:hypothetical protein